MPIGCHLPTQGPVSTREALTTFCQQAEKHEIASLWVSDHVVFPRSVMPTTPVDASRMPRTPRILEDGSEVLICYPLSVCDRQNNPQANRVTS